MAAILPLLLVAGAATAVVMGRNMEQISPSTAVAMEGAWENAGTEAANVTQGLQNFIAQDAEALKASERAVAKPDAKSEADSKSDGDHADAESDTDGDHEYGDHADAESDTDGDHEYGDHEYGDSDGDHDADHEYADPDGDHEYRDHEYGDSDGSHDTTRI